MQDNLEKPVGETQYSGAIERYDEHLREEYKEYQTAIVAAAADMMRPLIESVAKLLTGNVEALQQIAGALDMQNERMAALERTIKKRLPVTPAQVRYMNDAIRKRTHALLDGKEDIDAKAYTKLGNAIRRDVLVRCGAGSLRELPDHEYSASMDQIETWNNVLVIRDAIWEARDRVEAMASAEQSAGVDGA